MKKLEKIIGIGMLLFAIGFNLWLYRLEPTARIDPNDNLFQYALVHRTNEVWNFAVSHCNSFFPLPCYLSYLVDHWVPNWAEGYNLPYYYSHVPQIVIVASWRLFDFIGQMGSIGRIGLFEYYHFVIYLLLCFFPLSVFLALRVLRLPLLTASFGALIASHISADGLYGLEPASFLWRGYGLTSQLFAMIWLPLAIAYGWRYMTQSSNFKAQNSNQTQNSKVPKQKHKILGFDIDLPLGFWNLDVYPAVFFLTATTSGHLGIGIIAFLSLGVVWISPFLISLLSFPHEIVEGARRIFSRNNHGFRRHIQEETLFQIGKIAILFGSVLLLLGYWIIPIFKDGNYHNISVWDPIWKFDSYGYRVVLKNLFDGNLFDFERFPILTALVFIGAFAALRSKKDPGQARMTEKNVILVSEFDEPTQNRSLLPANSYQLSAFSLLFLFWLLMYFGRTTWGGLIDLVPGMTEFHLSRFIVGIQLAGLFLIPIGFQFIWEFIDQAIGRIGRIGMYWRIGRIQLVGLVCIGVLVGFTYPQTMRYSQHNDFLITRANENFLKQESDVTSLFSSLSSLLATNPGRVYFGRGANWGKNLKVAETEYYLYYSTFGIPTILWLPETWSPNSDTEQYFTDSKPQDYDLYNIRYVVAPPDQKPLDFWKLVKETKSWKLYSVVIPAPEPESIETTKWNPDQARGGKEIGYLTTGFLPAVVASKKTDYANLVHQWIQSDYPKNRMFPQLVIGRSDQLTNNEFTSSLPHFFMLDGSNYKVPDNTVHNIFAEPPSYMLYGKTPEGKEDWLKAPSTQQLNNVITLNQSNDSDMIYKATVEVKADCKDCLVILKSTYHPSWTATDDGKKVNVFNVFPFYNAVHVDSPGNHEVVFSYEPSRVKLFLLILSLLSILLLLFFTIYTRRDSAIA